VREQALAVLGELGFARREDLGRMFDPARHEAVGTVVDDEAPAGTVVHVARPGYGPDERVLRPAGVVVSTRS
jgi:molecular chaperone GrpE